MLKPVSSRIWPFGCCLCQARWNYLTLFCAFLLLPALLLSDAHPMHGWGTWEWAAYGWRPYVNLQDFLATSYNGENKWVLKWLQQICRWEDKQGLCCLEQFSRRSCVKHKVWIVANCVSVPLSKLWLSGFAVELEIFLAVCRTKAMLIFYYIIISITLLR